MILVTGTTGQLGFAVLAALHRRGIPAEGSSRSGRDGSRRVDFDRPDTIDFTGVSTLVLVSAGEAEDDVVIARHAAAIGAAERDGVRHLIYTSVTGAGDHLAFALAHRATERHLATSALQWTILRNGLYAELFGGLLGWKDDGLVSAFGDGVVRAAARGDLAEAAAIVAESPAAHAFRTHDLVGPPVSVADVAARLGVPHRVIGLDRYRESLHCVGLKPFQPAMIASIASAVRHGFLDRPSSDLVGILEREPVDGVALAASVAATTRPDHVTG
ncbi:NAD(P)H-binding protein [Stackebrandtia soli]|uniref:NAD(P)H-binding protein n=1 Tax=Stackebrandtia soli TaxID=1892856 RepID=UPI0039EC394C